MNRILPIALAILTLSGIAFAEETIHFELGPSITFSEQIEGGMCRDYGTIWHLKEDILLREDKSGNSSGQFEKLLDAENGDRKVGIILHIDVTRLKDSGDLRIDLTVRNAEDRFTILSQALGFVDEIVIPPQFSLFGFLNKRRPCPDGVGLQILNIYRIKMGSEHSFIH
jgi:hypothetical protein